MSKIGLSIVVPSDPDFQVRLWPVGEQVDLRTLGPIANELRPTECHIKPDGDVENRPSLVFVMDSLHGSKMVAQISASMFKPVLKEILRLQPNFLD